MKIKDLVVKARSYRRFQENRPVGADLLTALVDAARQAPSASNKQPLRYAVSVSPEVNARIFGHLRWAAQLKDWKGPAEGERPAGYIVIGGAESSNHLLTDLGIAAQTIQLGLAEAGVGCCMLANINPGEIHTIVGFPEGVTVLLVLAAGYPGETVMLDAPGADGSLNYWRDDKDAHHVPKRALSDVLLALYEQAP